MWKLTEKNWKFGQNSGENKIKEPPIGDKCRVKVKVITGKTDRVFILWS